MTQAGDLVLEESGQAPAPAVEPARGFGLRHALMVAVVAGLIAPALVGAWATLQQQRMALMHDLHADHVAMTEFLALGIEESLWALSPDHAQVAALMSDPRVVRVEVSADQLRVSVVEERPERRQGQQFVMTRPVIHGKARIGEVAIEMDSSSLDDDLAGRLRAQLAITGGQLVLSVVLIMLLLQGRLLRPLAVLMEQAGRLARRELGQSYRWDRGDELGLLGRQLEQTRAALAHLFDRLEGANRTLQSDIAKREEVEAALRASEERHQLAIRATSDGLWDWDLATDSVWFSPRLHEILGLPDGGLGRSQASWIARVYAADKKHYLENWYRVLESDAESFSFEYRVHHASGRVVWVLSRGVLVRGADGSVQRVVGATADINERKQYEQQLIQEALHDQLTGLPNRSMLIDRLVHAIRRHGPENQVALLFLDLDGFKVVNDTLGHSVGDRLLAMVAERLQSALEQNEVIARLGGDEFIILVEDFSDRDAALRTAERIQAELRRPFSVGGTEMYATASMGIAYAEANTSGPDALLRAADIALYRAKARGKSRYEVFDHSMAAGLATRLALETDLRKAVDKRQIFLAYQPVVDLADGRICGFEALLRWQHPDKGLISPVQFIPLAEDTGLIVPIGEFVLEEAARQLAEWRADFGPDARLTVAVNLSARQFCDDRHLDRVYGLIRKAALPPGLLKLEVTESLLMENPDHSVQVLQKMKDLGVQLCIDDFGTGYSSLAYLHRFPFDVLKIDRSFVTRLSEREDHVRLVRGMVNLAHDLGLSVVAEGVETGHQLQALRGMGCDFGQGYLFSPALTVPAAEDLVTTKPAW